MFERNIDQFFYNAGFIFIIYLFDINGNFLSIAHAPFLHYQDMNLDFVQDTYTSAFCIGVVF